MTRRVCQTCRHFQAAGFDNMGWCTHPKRCIGSDVRIYVRAHELPCRNDWATDLWQLAEQTNADVVLSASASPVPPATVDELSFLASVANRPKPEHLPGDGAARGEDIMVGEVTSLSANGESSLEENRREILRRAHEELRARKREHRSSVIPLADEAETRGIAESATWRVLESGSAGANTEGDDIVANREVPTPGQSTGEVSPVALGEMGRPFPKLTTFPEDDARFSSIPAPVDGFDLPLASKREPKRVVRRAGFDEDHGLSPWSVQADSPVVEDVPTPPSELERQHPNLSESEIDAFRTPRRRLIGRQRPKPVRQSEVLADEFLEGFLVDTVTEPLAPKRMVSSDRGGERLAAAVEDSYREPFASGLEIGIDRGQTAKQEPVRPHRQPEIYEPGDRAEIDEIPVRGAREHSRSQQLDSVMRPRQRRDYARPTVDEVTVELQAEAVPEREFLQSAEDLIVTPMAIAEEIEAAEPAHWSAIPRTCRTCRDFRPAENGERGWCTNKWAFSHRRMVDADELPCETSIGGWWLPHDDVWMSGVDVTAHSQPTPLLDQWLAQRAAASGEFDTAQPLRRRQRS